ncbi:MAG TPA: hypothetical protein VIH17_02370, partial [Candidatus Acidoferrales bacterium]
RQEAYAWVQEHAMEVWRHGGNFRERVSADSRITRFLSPAEIEAAFDFKRQLKYVDAIFQRVFGAAVSH